MQLPKQPEPEWPEWTRRDDEWVLVVVGRGVCACRWLNVVDYKQSLFGGVVMSYARCVDCEAVWEKDT